MPVETPPPPPFPNINKLNGRLHLALKKGAVYLQGSSNKLPKKMLIMGLLFFVTIAGGASLFVAISSLQKDRNPVIVTPVYLLQPVDSGISPSTDGERKGPANSS